MISRHIDSTIGPLVLRLSLGVTMLIAHGLPKLINFAAKSNTFPDPLGISPKLSLTLTVLAEVVCAICIILGAKVRLSSIPLIIAMAVATFVVHAGQPWHRQELAFIYLFGFITLFFTGPGKFALKE